MHQFGLAYCYFICTKQEIFLWKNKSFSCLGLLTYLVKWFIVWGVSEVNVIDPCWWHPKFVCRSQVNFTHFCIYLTKPATSYILSSFSFAMVCVLFILTANKKGTSHLLLKVVTRPCSPLYCMFMAVPFPSPTINTIKRHSKLRYFLKEYP